VGNLTTGNSVMNLVRASLSSLALIAVSTVGHAETYTYRLTEVSKGTATAINKPGHVTGKATVVPCCRSQAFLWRGTQPAPLIPLSLFPEGSVRSTGTDINNAGQIVVQADTGDGIKTYIWDGTTRPLVSLPGFVAGNAINESGHVTGRKGTNAFIWDGVAYRELGTGEGTDINASGLVTGCLNTSFCAFAWEVPLGTRHAFLWAGDTATDIGTLGGDFSSGLAINGKGQITGFAATPNNAAFHAFVWDGGLMMDLGVLEGYPRSLGVAINNSSQVIGNSLAATSTTLRTCGTFESTSCPFLWEKGSMRNLNDIIDSADPLGPNVKLREAIDINGLGQILVSGLNADDKVRAYLLSPRYRLTNILAPSASSVPRGSTVRVAVGVLDAEGVRIPDGRAAVLASKPCRVQVRATGAETLQKTCMKYDAATDRFFFDWTLGPTATGPVTIDIRVNYGAPGPLKTIKTKIITITN
jgi:probable HAF family extracellular repeat protein